MKILFKITTRSRQALFIRTINSILENIENKDNYHLLISIDDDDPAMNPPPVLKSEHYTYVSGKSKNKIDAINRDVNDFDYDWDILVNVSDDQVFILNGFDNIIRDAFSDNTDQYIHFSDGYQKSNVSSMHICGRKYYNRDNYIYCPEYISLWSDSENDIVAKMRNCYKYMGDDLEIFHHLHPTWGLAQMDEQYKRTQEYNIWLHDKDVFERRKKEGFVKKIISFSLWGDDKMYTIGAIKNAELAKILYPDWICRFYIGKNTPLDIINKLKSFSNTEVIEMGVDGNWSSMFWRFYPASENNVDIMISRDCDSRLSIRERLAVEEWIKSDKGFHIMRDHPYHKTEILGGMWGVKKRVLPNMKSDIDEFLKGEYKNIDQEFLAKVIYPLIKDNSIEHDEFFNYSDSKLLFPSKRWNKEFVGDVFDENDNRNSSFWKLIE